MEDRRARSLLPLLALVSLVLLSGCVDYPPTPTVCLTCEKGIENASRDSLNVSVESSELGIQIREDRTARWTVRANLSGPDVDELRSTPGLVAQLTNESVTDEVGSLAPYVAIHGGNVTNLSGRMEGDELVIGFTVPDAAEDGFGGTLLVDYFNTEGRSPDAYWLGTDRIVVRGPPGTVATHHPPKANVTEGGRAVVWQSPNAEFVTGETYVAFSPGDGLWSRLATRATVVAETTGWAAPWALQIGTPYALAMVGALVVFSRRWAGRQPMQRLRQGGSLKSRLVSRPPVDLLAVGLLYAGLVAGLFGGEHALVIDLFVVPPLVPIGLFFLLGVSLKRDYRVSRFLAAFLSGIPFIVAGAMVVTLPDTVLDRAPGLRTFFPFVGLLLVGGALFAIGTRIREKPGATRPQTDE